MDWEEKRAKINSGYEACWCEFTKEAQALVPEPPFQFGPLISAESGGFQITKPQTAFDKWPPLVATSPPVLGCRIELQPLRVGVCGFNGFDPHESSYLFDADDSGVFLCAEHSHKKLSPKAAADAIVGPFLEKYKNAR
jgi:hypothetical protein